ncbi:MAG TPA: hypothetical protein VG477_00325 [Thermoanaerobaculia bacterium]|nr:hypothetical protein [Thermoanaerobaculia bacterium]
MRNTLVSVSGRFASGACLLAGLLALAEPVAAQGELRVRLEGEAGVRDESDYGEEQDVLLRRDEARGYGGLNLDLSYALERLNLALNYSPSYERSLESSDISGTTHRLDFGLVGDLSRRSRLSIREQLLSIPDVDPYEPVAAAVTTVATRRGDQLVHNFDISLDNAVSRRTSVSLGLNHSLRRFEVEDFVDSQTLGARIGAAWELVRGRRIEALAGTSMFDYGDRGESDVLTFGLAYATELGRDSLLRLEAGAYSVESRRPTFLFPPPVPGVPPEPEPVPEAGEVREEDEGWRGSLQFSQRRQLFRWGFGLSHDISAGAGLGRAVEADNAFVDISWPLGRQWEIGLDGNASRQADVSDSLVLEGETMDELTEFAAGTARVSWTFTPAFRLSGGYSRVWQSSRVENFSDLSYSRYFLSLAFRIFSTGETPREPDSLGRPIDDDESDPQ